MEDYLIGFVKRFRKASPFKITKKNSLVTSDPHLALSMYSVEESSIPEPDNDY